MQHFTPINFKKQAIEVIKSSFENGDIIAHGVMLPNAANIFTLSMKGICVFIVNDNLCNEDFGDIAIENLTFFKLGNILSETLEEIRVRITLNQKCFNDNSEEFLNDLIAEVEFQVENI